MELHWRLEGDGELIQEGTLPAPELAAGDSTTVALPIEMPAAGEYGEVFLTVELALKAEAAWAPAGHVVAWEQFAVPYEAKAAEPIAAAAARGSRAGLRSNLRSLRRDGVYLRRGPRRIIADHFSRRAAAEPAAAAEFLAGAERQRSRAAAWIGTPICGKTAAANRRLESIDVEQLGPHEVKVTARQRLPVWNSLYVNTFTVRGDGELEVSATLDSEQDLPELVRFGMQLGLPRKMNRVAWFGRGPHESYWDRKTSAAVGLFRNSVAVYTTPTAGHRRTATAPTSAGSRSPTTTATASWPQASR